MRRLFCLSIKKISVLFGGRPLLILLTLLLLGVCFYTVRHAVTAERNDSVNMTVVDASRSELSSALVAAVREAPGFSVKLAEDIDSARIDMAEGRTEAILSIGADYDSAIADEAPASLIEILTAPGSVSAELIRETVAGKLLAQRAEVKVKNNLAGEGFSIDEFVEYEKEFTVPNMYRITTIGGGNEASRAVFGGGFPGYAGFAALAILLVMLTLTRQLAAYNVRLSAVRMRAVDGGRTLAFMSDAFAVLIPAFLFAIEAFLISSGMSIKLLAALLAYSVAVTGICLALSKTGGAGRIDAVSPFAALVTSILGGCFVELSSLSPALRIVARLTPQGQMIAAANGAGAFIPLLIAEGAVFALTAALLERRKA